MTRSGSPLSLPILFLIIASSLLAIPCSSFCTDLQTQHLFTLGRSKNANIVQYDVQLTSDGKLYPEKPVIAYWIRLAEDGRQKELTWFQRKWYYGFTTKYHPISNAAIIEMVRCQREIKISEKEGVYRGEVRIDGQPAFLERIFVTYPEKGLLRTGGYVELYGKDTKTGVDRYEKIGP